VDPAVKGSLIMNASVDVFFVLIPHQGSSHFSFELRVNVTNMGANDVEDFHTIKATVYRQNLAQIHTFDISSKQNESISGGSSKILNYDVGADVEGNLYDFSSIELFLRLLVTFNSTSDAIITSPLTPLMTAIE